ncbi:hypothetical protein [Streptosporangium roseum]|uniref:hypothetical protein n=1 Tax=Streptosporangium roseum TaxID=2001 RepID=UPI003318B5EA
MSHTDNTAAPEPKKLGDLIDRLGVHATLEEGDFITDVVVLAKVHMEGGAIAVGIYSSEDLQSYDKFAMLRMASDALHSGGHCHHGHGGH